MMHRAEIHFLGAAQADVDHVRAAARQALDQCVGQLRAFQAHVAADDHAARFHLRDKGTTDVACQRGIQLFRDAATDVVGHEAGEIRHPEFQRVWVSGRHDARTGGARSRPEAAPTGAASGSGPVTVTVTVPVPVSDPPRNR
jgi:hypothetical protein